jgi:serine/threonine-protein kinase RIO1
MPEKQAAKSKDPFEEINKRLDAIEKRLGKKEKKKKKEKKTVDKVTDSLSDATEKTLKETGTILAALTDSFVEAVNESADALSTLSEDTDTERLGRIPGAMVSVFRKGVEIQKKALEKFEESCEKNKD